MENRQQQNQQRLRTTAATKQNAWGNTQALFLELMMEALILTEMLDLLRDELDARAINLVECLNGSDGDPNIKKPNRSINIPNIRISCADLKTILSEIEYHIKEWEEA